ncbi:MAG: hypothetical protein AMJ43_10120 [Coxiella sp. DG_40]|nr:MAG: hypothetical protein AMJ43_10120 [Coxiella sp. DG_40]
MKDFMRRCSGLRLPAIIVFVMAACAVAIAENEARDPGEKEVLTTLEQRMQKRISIEFRDTAIEDVVRIMAEQADVDLILGPDVMGPVTVKLTDVPLEEALRNVLAAHGYDYEIDKNMIRVGTAAQIAAAAEKLTSKIYHITYANVEEVTDALNKFKSKQGIVSFNKGTSHIIVTDTETKIKAMDTFIDEVDRITPQVLVEVRIYDIIDKDMLDLGVEWFAGRRTNYGGEPTMDSDITVSRGGTSAYISSKTDPYITSSFDSEIYKAKGTTGLLRFGVLNEHIQLEALITAAEKKDAAKLLASPRVMVLDNEKAIFKSVTEIPYQRLQQGGLQSFGTTEFKEVGVELSVTPHVTKDGLVRLHIVPVFSVQTGNVDIVFETYGGQTMPQPVVDKREADTVALVKDGQTVVIGGLRQQRVSQLISKIPLFGDMPLVGALFKFEGEEITNNELVVFITPYIIEQPTLSPIEQQQLEATKIPPPKGPTLRLGSDGQTDE